MKIHDEQEHLAHTLDPEVVSENLGTSNIMETRELRYPTTTVTVTEELYVRFDFFIFVLRKDLEE